MKIGEKVVRIKGSNSGMKIGDIGTIMMIKSVNGIPHVKLKEYSNGWHNVNYLEKKVETKPMDELMITFEVDKSINWEKIAKHLHKAIKFEEDRREQSELDKLKQQRDELDKKIKDIEENKVAEISTDSINNKLTRMVSDDLLDAKAFRKGRTITVVISNAVSNKTLGKGVATAMPGDKFNEELGLELAYCRALESYWRRKSHKIIRETY